MQQVSGFEKVYTFAIGKCPQLAAKNTSTINEWLATGYDPDLDIIPAIMQATSRGGLSIKSFNFFSGFIRTVNERRVKCAAAPIAPTPEQREHRRAEAIKIMHRTGIYVPDADWQWLQQYEEKARQNA